MSSQTMAIIAGAALLGGMYITSMRAVNKMCADKVSFNTKMASFQAGCPTTKPSTIDVMRYFVL